MKFLLTLILLYIGFRLVAKIALWFIAYKIRKATGATQSMNEEEENTKRDRKKIIRKDAGDYVDFEEIEKK